MRDLPKKPTNTDEYLALLPVDQRTALETLRKQILAAAPGAGEHFGYGMPAFKYNGHPMLYIGAAKKHCALYGSVPAGLKERLKGFDVDKGTIRFTPEKPLPVALVKDIVRAKVAEIEVRWPVLVKKAVPDKAVSGASVANDPAVQPVLAFETAQAWDAWLGNHGATSKGVFLKIGKKGSGLRSITAEEALEVALCHGWIDAIRKGNDDKTFLQRYTPRGPRSIWSEINKKKVLQLMKARRMHPAGLAAVERAKANGQWDKAYAPASTITVPPDLEAALKKNRKARDFFATLKSSNRFAFLHRLHTAKKEETRARRLALFIGMMERGETFH
ncbi:MAG: YdeI/OmpD-associated family protein [Flavobacteriales bacterium]|nr:YdeI/OmpD-associated family protein [Flavobacteriales bacterium]